MIKTSGLQSFSKEKNLAKSHNIIIVDNLGKGSSPQNKIRVRRGKSKDEENKQNETKTKSTEERSRESSRSASCLDRRLGRDCWDPLRRRFYIGLRRAGRRNPRSRGPRWTDGWAATLIGSGPENRPIGLEKWWWRRHLGPAVA